MNRHKKIPFAPDLAPREGLALVLILGVGFALRFWRIGALSLVGDESYYWLWSRYPAFSYFDHPSGVVWVIRLSTTLGGGSEFGVRWLNALLGLACVPLVFAIGRRLFSSAAGLVAAGALAVAAPYLVISRLVYTDMLPAFLMLANLYGLLPILLSPQSPAPPARARWGVISITWLLLLNTKVSVYPYFAALGLGMFLWRRDLLRDRRLWLAVLMAAPGILPYALSNIVHGWGGVAFSWQQFTQGTVATSDRLRSAYHMLTYLTPPFAAFCGAGLLMWRVQQGRWLLLIALCLLTPVLLSPADSPRNLLLGCLPMVILAGEWFAAKFALWRCVLLALLGLGLAVYGVGTMLALIDETPLPHSSVARAIRQDAIGWPALGGQLKSATGLLFTVDYSSASQLWFYSGRPVYSHWGQYLVWGIPDFDEATIVSEGYVSPATVSRQLESAFDRVDGPMTYDFTGLGTAKQMHLWHGRGLRVSKQEFGQMLDFFALHRSERGR